MMRPTEKPGYVWVSNHGETDTDEIRAWVAKTLEVSSKEVVIEPFEPSFDIKFASFVPEAYRTQVENFNIYVNEVVATSNRLTKEIERYDNPYCRKNP